MALTESELRKKLNTLKTRDLARLAKTREKAIKALVTKPVTKPVNQMSSDVVVCMLQVAGNGEYAYYRTNRTAEMYRSESAQWTSNGRPVSLERETYLNRRMRASFDVDALEALIKESEAKRLAIQDRAGDLLSKYVDALGATDRLLTPQDWQYAQSFRDITVPTVSLSWAETVTATPQAPEKPRKRYALKNRTAIFDLETETLQFEIEIALTFRNETDLITRTITVTSTGELVGTNEPDLQSFDVLKALKLTTHDFKEQVQDRVDIGVRSRLVTTSFVPVTDSSSEPRFVPVMFDFPKKKRP